MHASASVIICSRIPRQDSDTLIWSCLTILIKPAVLFQVEQEQYVSMNDLDSSWKTLSSNWKPYHHLA